MRAPAAPSGNPLTQLEPEIPLARPIGQAIASIPFLRSNITTIARLGAKIVRDPRSEGVEIGTRCQTFGSKSLQPSRGFAFS